MCETDEKLLNAVEQKRRETVLLTDADVQSAKRVYHRAYYRKHADRIRAYRRQWRKDNPAKVKLYNERTWLRAAAKMKQAAANHSEED